MEEQSAAINRLSAAIRDVAPLEQIQKEAAVTFEALVRAADASTHADLNTIQSQIEQSIRRIDDLVSGLDPDVWFEFIAPSASCGPARWGIRASAPCGRSNSRLPWKAAV